MSFWDTAIQLIAALAPSPPGDETVLSPVQPGQELAKSTQCCRQPLPVNQSAFRGDGLLAVPAGSLDISSLVSKFHPGVN